MVHVLAVRAGVREAFETLLTLERLLAAVQSLVLRQVVLVFERFRTHVALVRALTCDDKSVELISSLHFEPVPIEHALAGIRLESYQITLGLGYPTRLPAARQSRRQ